MKYSIIKEWFTIVNVCYTALLSKEFTQHWIKLIHGFNYYLRKDFIYDISQ